MEPNSKKQLKIDKITRKKHCLKQVLKDKQIKNNNQQNRQFEQHQQILNETEYELQYIDPQIQVKKSKQWWNNLDKTYFNQLNRRDILFTRNITTSQKLSNYFNYQPQFNGSYFNQQIQPYYINQDQNTLIRVLFKSTFQIQIVKFSCVNYTQIHNRKVNKNKQQNNQLSQNQLQNWKIINFNPVLHQIIQQQKNHNLQQIIKNINFEYLSTINDSKIIQKILKFQQIKKQMKYNQNQIDLELKLWQMQREKLNTKNSILWNTLLSNFIGQQTKQKQKKYSQQQINLIKQLLTHYTILRYFEHGTKDKTFLMLKALIESMKHIKPLKGRQANNKKFFQTDCKICFCSFNSDSNQVLYCDMCNTSFHLACYGLNKIPEDKQYFCDCCTYIKKQQKLKNSQIKKITCQICCKASFPIKYVNGHFYHITCLVIFNLITFESGQIKLRQNFSNENILKKVVQSQLNCSCCIFCTGTQGSESGMQFKCSYFGCQASMHPICAYINGCLFQVKKNMKQKMLDVKIFCNKHDNQRDYIQQSYLRRYMCNFKNTSIKTLQSFRTQYQSQLQQRQNKLNKKEKNNLSLPSLLIESKNVKKYCSVRQQKQLQKNNQIEITQTGKMLQKLVKQYN